MIQFRIKELCSSKGVSQKDLGQKIGVSPTSLSRISTGEQKPSIDTLEKIATALGVEVSELFAAPAEGVITCPHCGKPIELHPTLPENCGKEGKQ